jgi:cbb3-type cytochrome oxidase maturation protein
MDILVFLIVLSLILGLIWFVGFLWAMREKQFDDLDMAALRALSDDKPKDDNI